MDPNLPAPQTNQTSQQNGPVQEVKESAAKFWGNHYESWIRAFVGLVLSALNFIKFSIGSIIKQVLSRD